MARVRGDSTEVLCGQSSELRVKRVCISIPSFVST